VRVLGIDLGEKRIGLALSDAMGILASPFEVFEYESKEEALRRVGEVVKRERVKEVVVGLPLRMDGSPGPQAEAAKAFAAALEEMVEAAVICWDERLTSVQAQRALLEGNVSRAGRRMRADMVAAALLLQSYLDARREREGSRQ